MRPTDQVPTKLTDQVTAQEIRLIKAIAAQPLSIKQLMEVFGLKHRRTFVVNYLEPAIADGLVALLYPDSPRHPRQKYRLTIRGLALLRGLASPGE